MMNNKNDNNVIEGKKSMNILKKIALGAVIMLAGVFALPGKVWAADPSVTLSVDSVSGKISYTATDCVGCDLKLSVALGGGASADKSAINITETPQTGDLSTDMSGAITFLGATSVEETTAYTISAIVDPKSTGITAPTVEPKSGSVYAGKVYAETGHTHLSISDTSVKRTLDVNAQYGVDVMADTSSGAWFVSSKTVGTNSPEAVNLLETTITNKISEGNVVMAEAKAAIYLNPEPATVTPSGYTADLSVVPADAPYKITAAEVKNVTLTSSTGSITKADADFPNHPATNLLSIEVAGTDGTKATAKLVITMADTATQTHSFSEQYSFNISIEKAKPTKVEVYGEPVIYVGDGPEIYYYDVYPSEFEDDPVSWSAKVSKTGVATAKKLSDGTLEVTPKAEGTVTITATVDGVVSNSFVVTVLKEPEIVTDVVVSGPTQITVGKGSTATYTAQVILDNGKKATNQKVTWEVDNTTLATISSAGVLTLTNLAEAGDTIYITATSVEDDTVFTDYEVEVVDIVKPTELSYNTTDITKGMTIDNSVGKNISTNPSGAAKNIKSISWSPANGGGIITISGNGSSKVTFKGTKAGSVTMTPTVTYTNGEVEDLDSVEFIVRDDLISDVEFGSNDKLSFKLPDTAFTSHDSSKNINEVTGYQIDIMKEDGTVLYTVTKSGTDSISIDGDTIEDYVEKAGASGKLSKDSEKVIFRVSPRGKSQKDGKTTVTNTDAGYTMDARTIYRVTVPETTYINGAYVYGLPDHEVTITASPKSGYKFANWEDGSTSTTRKVKVSTTTSKNTYNATANTTGTPSSTAGNSTNKNGTNSNLDKVPKTGESMAIYWIIMIAVISGCVAASIIYKYMIKRK